MLVILVIGFEKPPLVRSISDAESCILREMRDRPNITVVDYGAGNILSVCRGLERIGANVSLSADAGEILRAEKVVLPGVGAFKSAMIKLEKRGLVEALRKLPSLETPLLGICLGMEILFEESQEFGSSEGLGLIPGQVVPIKPFDLDGQKLKMPHIGWNNLVLSGDLATAPNDIAGQAFKESAGREFYFVHSFMAQPTDPTHTLLHTFYGGNEIPSVVRNETVYGVQFHPEKSGNAGLELLKAFSRI